MSIKSIISNDSLIKAKRYNFANLVTYNLVADSAYNSQGWTTGTDYTGTNGSATFSYSFSGGLQQTSGGAATIALPATSGLKYYFEVLLLSLDGNQNCLVGVSKQSVSGYSNVPCVYMNNGAGFGGLTAALGGPFVPNDTLQVAYDVNNNLVQFARNGSAYTSSVSIPGTGSIRLSIMMAASTGTGTLAGKFKSKNFV